MNIKAAKHLVKIVAAFAFIVLGAVSLNAAAAVINATTGDAEFGGSLAETSGNVVHPDISVDEPTVEGSWRMRALRLTQIYLGKCSILILSVHR